MSDTQLAEIERALRQTPAEAGLRGAGPWDGKTLSAYLRQTFAVSLKPRQCQRLFRQLGFRRRKPRPLIAHANPQAQAEYKNTSVAGGRSRRRPLGNGRSAFPATRFGCQMSVSPEVKDPVLLHHPTRRGVGYFGAVRLRDGKFLAMREEHMFDAQSTSAFYRRLRRGKSPLRPTGDTDHRQRQVSPCAPAPLLAGSPVAGLRAVLLAAIQSRSQSHRTGLETGPPTLLA